MTTQTAAPAAPTVNLPLLGQDHYVDPVAGLRELFELVAEHRGASNSRSTVEIVRDSLDFTLKLRLKEGTLDAATSTYLNVQRAWLEGIEAGVVKF